MFEKQTNLNNSNPVKQPNIMFEEITKTLNCSFNPQEIDILSHTDEDIIIFALSRSTTKEQFFSILFSCRKDISPYATYIIYNDSRFKVNHTPPPQLTYEQLEEERARRIYYKYQQVKLAYKNRVEGRTA